MADEQKAFDLAELAAKVGKAVAELAVPRLPALKRMGVAELAAVWREVRADEYDKATKLIHDAMTAPEMADEKHVLTVAAQAMANDQAESDAFLKVLGVAATRAALGYLLAAAGFPFVVGL